MFSRDRRLGTVYQWTILTLLGLVYFLATATTFTSLGVVLPGMLRELHWSWTDAGFGFTLLGLTCGLSSFLPTLCIRKTNVKVTLFTGLLLFLAGFYSLYTTETIQRYFVGTAFLGIGFTFMATVPGTYVISRLFSRQSLAFGFYFTLGGLGGVVGPWIYFLAVNVFGSWRIHWLIAALTLTVMTVITLLVLREGRREVTHARAVMWQQKKQSSRIYRSRDRWTARQALRTWQFYVIAASYTAFLWCGFTVNSFAVPHITDNGFSETIAATLLSTMAFINAFSRLAGGAIGEWLEPKKLLIISLATITLGVLTLSIATSWPLLILFTILVGIGYGMTFLASSVLLANYFGRGPYLELFSVVNLISTFACLAPFFAGTIKDYSGSFTPAFLVVALPVIAILAVTFFMHPPQHKPVKARSQSAS
ncbi:MFS transporter [Morganella psychrotolerans]|uniref:MFS transporter n=1 Tax=Morganella psychrotolerans TaxID=368603 RepID=A0A5M9QYK7_9GAMM|nr:MFS transporter [Morganella psychrotolerans]KAA8713470.1 MFS transporter [Morganella psychrotolerans]OBU06461.1 MFS transporter [Morganella psychrotolerans]